MRLDGGFFRLYAVAQQVQGMPARDKGEVIGRHQLAQLFGVGGPAVAVFNPVKADLGGLTQDLVGRDMRAKGLVVVIGPGDRVGAKKDHLVFFLSV